MGPVSNASARAPSSPSAVAASTVSNARAAGSSDNGPPVAGAATGTPAAAKARGNREPARGTDRTMTAMRDQDTPSIRWARRSASAIIVASACADAARRTVTEPSSAPVPSICLPPLPPGSRRATPLTARAIAGAQRCDTVSVTDGASSANTPAGSPPRKPKTAWLGSPATSAGWAPAASTRTRRAACGSSCWASSTSRSRSRARSAASNSGSSANASNAAPTSSAAPSAGAVACGAAVPTAARSNVTCSYCRANWPAAVHSGRRHRRPSRSSSCGPTPRSKQRANRFRSSVAKPAVVRAGRSSAGHDAAARGPSSRSPASSSRMTASCSALVTSRGGASPARSAARRKTAYA